MRTVSKQLIYSIPVSAVLIVLYYGASANLIYNATNIMCQGLALIFLWNVFQRLRRKVCEVNYDFLSILKKWLFTALSVCVTVVLFCSPCFASMIDYHKLGLEPTGARCGYAVLAENQKHKTYTLEAEVYVGSAEEMDFEYDYNTAGYEERSKTVKEYYVSRIYFSNGGYLRFEEPLIFRGVNDTCAGVAQKGDEWDVTLLDSYIGNQVNARSPLDVFDYVIWICSMLFSVLLAILWYKDHKYELCNDN